MCIYIYLKALPLPPAPCQEVADKLFSISKSSFWGLRQQVSKSRRGQMSRLSCNLNLDVGKC